MTESPGDDLSEIQCVNAITNITYVTTFGVPMVLARPKKINLAAIEGLLVPGEKLLSWGTLPKSPYFAFDEHLLSYMLFCFVAFANVCAGLLHFTRGLLDPQDWTKYLLFIYLGCLCFRSIRKATYVLTNKRLMRIGLYVHVFDLSTFDRAVPDKDEHGANFIELWRKEDDSPSVVLEVGGDTEQIAAVFPLTIVCQEKAPALPAVPGADEDGPQKWHNR